LLKNYTFYLRNRNVKRTIPSSIILFQSVSEAPLVHFLIASFHSLLVNQDSKVEVIYIYSQYNLDSYVNPHFSILYWVASLFFIVNQSIKTCFGIAHENQTICHHATTSNLNLIFPKLLNLPDLEGIQ
jgi:hypothetical protein